MNDPLIEYLHEATQAAVNESVTQPSPEESLKALQHIMVQRAMPNTAPQQAEFKPQLVYLARHLQLVVEAEGLYLKATAAAAVHTLTTLRRGTLWMRGGDLEAEFLSWLESVGS